MTSPRALTTTPRIATHTHVPAVTPAPRPHADWRTGLPVLDAGAATLRELQLSDAAALRSALTAAEVTRFISPPPTTVEGFERFIAWTQREQAAGRYMCFAIVPKGHDAAAGIIQIRQLDSTFTAAEWGFALSSALWGTGLFQSAARAVIEFAFNSVGIHRLEARSAVDNGRGNGALQKLGATREGVLRKSFLKDGQYYDQILWGLVSSEWSTFGAFAPPIIH
jgi:RimJ/RimL family protein N-acetyltransferase